MTRVFADTSYYVALMGEHDQHHSEAVALAREFFGQIITTDFVLVEVGNLLSRSADRHLLIKLLESLDADVQTTVVPASRDLFNAGRSLFAKRMDKDWSLTDCISFAVMHREGLVEALTADHHFEQAGFRVLLEE